MNKIFKTCSIYRKSTGYFIFPKKHTDYGEISQVPAIKLPSEATASELGETVLQVLNNLSGKIVEVDLAGDMNAFRAHLKELGFKTTSAFEKNAAVTSVRFDGQAYSVTLYRKDERNANMETGSTLLGANPTAEEIGKAMLAALENPA